MDRKGMNALEFIGTAILVFAAVAAGLYIFQHGSSNSMNQLASLSSCGGTLGIIGGKAGYCSADKSCSDVDALARNDKITNVYFTNIGSGFGCPDPKVKSLPSKQYCCLGMDKSQNPPSAQDVQAQAALDGTGDPVLTVRPVMDRQTEPLEAISNGQTVVLNVPGVTGINFAVNSKKNVACSTLITITGQTGDDGGTIYQQGNGFNSCNGVADFAKLLLPIPKPGSYVKYQITTSITVDGQPAKLRVQTGSTTALLSDSLDQFTGTMAVGAYNDLCTNTNNQPGRYCNSVLSQGKQSGTIQSGTFAGKDFVCTIDRATGVCTLYMGTTAGTGNGFRNEDFNTVAPCTSVVNEQGTASTMCTGVQAPCVPSSLSPSSNLYVCLPKIASGSGNCLVVYVSAADQDKAKAQLNTGSYTYQGTTYTGVTIC